MAIGRGGVEPLPLWSLDVGHPPPTPRGWGGSRPGMIFKIES